ncbi:unnamed protein product, partial [Protopolystoma xenopodis]
SRVQDKPGRDRVSETQRADRRSRSFAKGHSRSRSRSLSPEKNDVGDDSRSSRRAQNEEVKSTEEVPANGNDIVPNEDFEGPEHEASEGVAQGRSTAVRGDRDLDSDLDEDSFDGRPLEPSTTVTRRVLVDTPPHTRRVKVLLSSASIPAPVALPTLNTLSSVSSTGPTTSNSKVAITNSLGSLTPTITSVTEEKSMFLFLIDATKNLRIDLSI